MGQADVKLVYAPLDGDRTAEKLDALLAAPTAIEKGARSAEPVAWAGSAASCLVGRVCQSALVDRKAAASDALREPVAQSLQLGNSLIDPLLPSRRQTRPVLARRTPIGRKLRELRTDFLKSQPDPLREHDESDAPQNRPGIASMSRARPHGRD
jgi:hypothetical protein